MGVIVAIIALVLIALGGYFYMSNKNTDTVETAPVAPTTEGSPVTTQ